LFPATDATGAVKEDRVLHIVAFPMTFMGAEIGLIVMSRRMARDLRWRSLATYALTTGIAVLVLILAGAGLVRSQGAPLHPWWGLFQWILLAVWFPCTVVLALRLLRDESRRPLRRSPSFHSFWHTLEGYRIMAAMLEMCGSGAF
jgi:hypothetical protein